MAAGVEYRIISIGALSVHELWPRGGGAARTPHATTTLVRSEGRVILVDPGLPPQVVVARLEERAGLTPNDVTDVFLTNFRPAHRWALPAFEHARWLIGEAERETIGVRLIERLRRAEAGDDADAETAETLRREVAVLQRCQAAPDRIAAHVDLFPLPGYTPGTCGLLLSHPSATTVIAGDAVATVEHLEQGRVLRGAYDANQAQQSLAEVIEIADVIVPGHDNVILNPVRRGRM